LAPIRPLASSNLNIFFIILFIWSIYQFYKLIEKTSTYNYNRNFIDRVWDKKTFFHFDYGLDFLSPEGFRMSDPNLRFRMLDLNLSPISKLDNNSYILNKCQGDSSSNRFAGDIKILNQALINPGAHLISKQKIEGKAHYLFCMEIDGLTEKDLFIWSSPFNEPPNAQIQVVGSKSIKTQLISLPIYLPNSGSQDVHFTISNMTKINVKKIGLIQYSANELPIRVESFLPLKINFDPQNFNMFFEPFKVSNKNYQAKVNSKEVDPIYVSGRSLLVPVKSGDYSLELLYRPPSFLFYIFLLSLCTILFSIFYFLIRSCIELIQSRLK
jgi:hypothetical protein